MIEHAYLIPLIPFAASLIILFGGKEDPHTPLPWVGIGGMAICLGLAVSILWSFAAGSLELPYERNWEWFSFATTIGGKSFVYDMPIGVKIDPPAALLLVVVTLVSLMVQVYSISYMHGDKRFKRYFAFVSFFTAAMLGLVVSSNLLVLFACWELMGLASYLLIGFWFEKEGPTEAQKKAFMTTKLGDSGLYLALLFIYAKVGSFQMTQIQSFVEGGMMPHAAALAIAAGIFVGAMGKSAQFPLFIWLPDAMEGPTPGSALIHAATMVAAGIIVVAKTYFFFLAAPEAMQLAAWIGAITAFMAASMALVSYDIKRVLAFSTVSQLGFMMCALGVGGYTAGLFHLTTHAFFKALLFLGAGSVIHSVHTNDMRQMGGLSKAMPITFLTMFLATCAIAGVPFLSGAYSKDMILASIWHSGQRPLFWLMLFTALMTAFYMFRLVFLTFTGNHRDHDKYHHAHESPALITGPLLVLAVLSVVAGAALAKNDFIFRALPKPALKAAAVQPMAEGVKTAVEALGKVAAADSHHVGHAPTGGEAAHGAPAAHAEAHAPAHGGGHHDAHLPHAIEYMLIALIFCAIGLSWWMYRGPTYPLADGIKATMSAAFTLLDRRWYIDDVFYFLVKVSDKVAALAFWIDANVVDRVFVDGWGLLMRIFAEISNFFDALFIDNTVDGVGGLGSDLGVGLRSLVREGQVQEYLMYAAIAFSLAATLILTR